MPTSDFDVESLAAYLHMMPAQIARLADRGKIPARKVGGKWRFSRPEIHHWLEERIGLSDEQELVQMEGVLRRAAAPDADEPVTIEHLLPLEAIALPLGARTRSKVITQMTELAAGSGWLWDAKTFAEAVEAREMLQSTALDSGVALLHPRRPLTSLLERSFLALGVTLTGIPFGGSRGTTDIFFLICSVKDQAHLRILARLSRLIGDADLLAKIRASSDAPALRELLIERDRALG